jgi:hypothetical protein
MSPPPIPTQPPPIPKQPTVRGRDAVLAALGVIVLFVIFGSTGGSDKPAAPIPSVAETKPAPAVANVAAPAASGRAILGEPMSDFCHAITAWKGKPISDNPSPAEARAWQAELDAKMNNPRWVKCMTDRYPSLLD